MKVVDFLKSAKQWTKHVSARRADGIPVSARDKLASSWCLLGAVTRCYRNAEKADAAISKLMDVVGPGIAGFNDANATTFRDVRRVLKEADV